MTITIAFSARKQAGKNTACNFILGHTMNSIGVIRGTFKITDKGELWISDLFGDTRHEGIFDYFRDNEGMTKFKAEHLDKTIKIYSFAEPLKQDVGVNILGLKREQVFGTDEQKNTHTLIKWEDCPGVITKPLDERVEHEEVVGRLGKYYDRLDGIVYHEPGFMTAREVLQYVGTEVFRKLSPNCWVDATLRKIQKEAPLIALICDCRFPNEADGVHKLENGIVVRFTRNSDNGDTHASETSLDNYEDFDVIIQNDKMTIGEQNQAIYSLMVSVGLVEASKEE